MTDVALVDLAGRPIPNDSRRSGVPDEAIRAGLSALYRDRAAAGLDEPCREEMFDAAGLKSWRVEQVRDVMRAAGELPTLPRRRRERTGRARRGPEAPPPAYPLEPAVREHRARERRLGVAIASGRRS